MNLIKRKLRSQSGASMLIAMVFMMFCVFIGGSVLVSATANAYRVAHLNEQQDFLNQRSAALLLSDRLQLEKGQQFRLHVVDAYRTTKEVNVGNGGVVTETGTKAEERVITFQLITNDRDVTEMQRLMLETTVWRYLREKAVDEKCIVEIIGFGKNADNTNIALTNFWYTYAGAGVDANGKVQISSTTEEPVKGSMNVTGTADNVTLPGYTANFSSGKGEELYDFHVDFGDLSQLRLTMDAFSGTSDPITVDSPATEGLVPGQASGTGYIQVTTRSTQTTISWDDPLIEKGGAEA